MSRNIEDLTGEMQQKYSEFSERMRDAGEDFILTCGYRYQSEQDALYAQGRTTPGKIVTKVKKSRHTDREAFDIAVLKNGKISWNNADYEPAGQIGENVGLVWGGSWKTFKDFPHFELPNK